MGKTKTSCDACGSNTQDTLCSTCRDEFKKWIKEYNYKSTSGLDSDSSSEVDIDADYIVSECSSTITSSSSTLTALHDLKPARDMYTTIDEWLEYSDDLIYM